MKEEIPPFGLPVRKKNPLNEYIGRYVRVKKPGMNDEGGRLESVDEEGRGILNPFVYSGYNPDGTYYATMKAENLSIYLKDATIMPETLKNLMGYCVQINEKILSRKTEK